MAELIHEHIVRVEDADGALYLPRTYGEPRVDGTWSGWIEFHPLNGVGRVLSTGQETSQPSRDTLAYWASGLETVYFEGALARTVEVPADSRR